MPETDTVQAIELVPRTVVQEDGAGPATELLPDGPRMFVVRLEIYDVIDQESLDISVWGSADGEQWGPMPILKLPQSFYPGSRQMVLDLASRLEVKFIQARWEVNRWGRGRPVPMFDFRVIATPA